MGRVLMVGGIAAGTTLLVDQATKALARHAFEPGERKALAFGGAIAVGHVQNPGSAYGLVGAMPAWIPAVASVAIGGGMLALGRGSRFPTAAAVGAGLVFGGGIGNVVDRLHQGHVTDMIHTSDLFANYNVADAAITSGMVLGIGAALVTAR